jgi:hypothetical protein
MEDCGNNNHYTMEACETYDHYIVHHGWLRFSQSSMV